MNKLFSLLFYACFCLITFTFLGLTFGIKIALVGLAILIYCFYLLQEKPFKIIVSYIKRSMSKLLAIKINKSFLTSNLLKFKGITVGNKLKYLKKLFLNKSFYIFLSIFVLGNIALYSVTYNNQESLALNEKIYDTNVYLTNVVSEDLLLDKFNNEPYSSSQGYLIYSFLLLGLMLSIEFYILGSTIAYRKHSPKIYLVFYFLILQILVIFPPLVTNIASSHIISTLNAQAKVETAKQITLLSNNDSRRQLSIISSPEEIKKTLGQSSTPPIIVDEQTDSQAVIQSFQIQDKDTFYRVVIIPRYLLTQNDLNLTFDALLFPNNVLVIKKATRDLLSNILPILSIKIVDSEMGQFLISKKEPIFNVLSDDAYNIIQTQKIEERKSLYLKYINDLKSSLADANRFIPQNQVDIKSLEKEKADYINRTNDILRDCESLYSIDECKRWRDIVSNNIASYDEDLKSINEDLQTWLYLKPRLTNKLQQITKNYEEFLKFPITPELQAAVFNIPNQIYIKYYSEGDLIKRPSDYINAGLHEYLHFEAYKSLAYLPLFIDEGITDYLANKLIDKYSSSQEVAYHYPDEILIVQEIIKHIPEDKLIGAYFNQSENELKNLFESYYLKGTYKEFVSMGEDLTYMDANDFEGRKQASEAIVQFLTSSIEVN